MKKIIFYGLGGAGQRHLRIIDKLKFSKKLFSYRALKKIESLTKNFKLQNIPLEKKYKNLKLFNNQKNSLQKIMNDSFVCNHTKGHYLLVEKNLIANRNVFVEKPFFCKQKQFAKIKKIILSKKLRFLVGYQRRFHKLVIKLKKLIESNNPIVKKVYVNVNSDVTQWHKYEDFKNLYACKKSLGGGSILTECHEIDLILYFFGTPKKVYCKKFFNKKYNLDVETKHRIIMYYDKFKVFFNINMACQKQIKKRFLEIVLSSKVYLLDLENNMLTIKNTNSKKSEIVHSVSADENLRQFEKQILYFYSKKYNVNKSIEQAEKNSVILNCLIKSSRINKIIKI